MIIGYARTSTTDQKYGLDAQLDELQNVGCEKIYDEQVSSVAKRQKLDEVLDFVRDGDIIIVTKLDRLARSVSHLWSIVEKLEKKNVSLRILNIALDTSTATGKLMLSLLGAVAEFEREMMLERQRDGIARAREAGKQFGRTPTARQKSDEIKELVSKGIGMSEIAATLGISRASAYKYAK